MRSASEFRQMARETLRGNWKLAMGTGLAASLIGADFNGDGAVNAVDTLLIMRFSLGLIEAVVKEPVQDA